MSYYYTTKILAGNPAMEQIRFFTSVNEAGWKPLDGLIAEAREALRGKYGFSDLNVDRVSKTTTGRYCIELTCYH